MAKVNSAEKTSAGEVPKVHSNADAVGDGRLSAPSAVRNSAPIRDVLAQFLPRQGTALELASGTGQHVVAYARAFPGIQWQPTDIAPDRVTSINAWVAAEGRTNVLRALDLDAGQKGWDIGRFDVVIASNLFHLISAGMAENVLAGAARALNPNGILFLYGPFRKGAAFRSQGDAEFDARIKASDTQAGYKDVEWMTKITALAGLTHLAEIEMPANNLSLAWQKPA